MSISREELEVLFNKYGPKPLLEPAKGVVIERADYAEIAEINRQLSEERDIQREEDFYAESSARDIYAG